MAPRCTPTQPSTDCGYERVARQILGEADAVDREEDGHHGHKRGNELLPGARHA